MICWVCAGGVGPWGESGEHPLIVDYHMHLERDDYPGRCRMDRSRIEQYVEAARRRGVDEIAITEHAHRFTAFRPIMESVLTGERGYPQYREWAATAFHDDLGAYADALLEAKSAGLPVKVGIEVDWIPGREEEIARVLAPYPWDVVLGSVHFLGPWCVDFSPDVGWPERNVDEVFEAYYRELARAAASGLFDVLAHPDLVKKFGHWPSFDPAPLWRDVVRAAAGAGCCVEVSTAGLEKPVGEIYPALEFLRMFREAGVPITLASDAHVPEEVGRHMDAAVSWAKQAGYDRVAVFEGRAYRLESLP